MLYYFQIASLLRAVTCLDLTTLCGDDSSSNVQRLCFKAQTPINEEILQSLGINPSGKLMCMNYRIYIWAIQKSLSVK